ncbi:unnamed protein product, partial [Prorocentrum cordatum]
RRRRRKKKKKKKKTRPGMWSPSDLQLAPSRRLGSNLKPLTVVSRVHDPEREGEEEEEEERRRKKKKKKTRPGMWSPSDLQLAPSRRLGSNLKPLTIVSRVHDPERGGGGGGGGGVGHAAGNRTVFPASRSHRHARIRACCTNAGAPSARATNSPRACKPRESMKVADL